MAAESHKVDVRARPSRRRWIWALGTFAVVAPASLAVASWWFNEPLKPAPTSSTADVARSTAVEPPAAETAPTLAWPDGRLEGEEAKRLLLAILEAGRERLERVPGYTATFRKHERIKGKLGPEQTLRLKVRHEPFSVYLKYLAPKAGKEGLYVAGQHDGHVIAHNGDWTRRLVPRLKVAPDSPLALADNRHPITEAGLLNFVDKLIHFRRLDLADSEAVTVLDRVTDDQGRGRLRSFHTHPSRHDDRPFKDIEVLYDPETLLPVKITSYDWPEPGHEGALELAEQYIYEDLDFDAALSDRDFDLTNPEYEFTRY